MTVGNETKPLMIWAKEKNIPPYLIRKRIYDGWSIESAVLKPLCYVKTSVLGAGVEDKKEVK